MTEVVPFPFQFLLWARVLAETSGTSSLICLWWAVVPFDLHRAGNGIVPVGD